MRLDLGNILKQTLNKKAGKVWDSLGSHTNEITECQSHISVIVVSISCDYTTMQTLHILQSTAARTSICIIYSISSTTNCVIKVD